MDVNIYKDAEGRDHLIGLHAKGINADLSLSFLRARRGKIRKGDLGFDCRNNRIYEILQKFKSPTLEDLDCFIAYLFHDGVLLETWKNNLRHQYPGNLEDIDKNHSLSSYYFTNSFLDNYSHLAD